MYSFWIMFLLSALSILVFNCLLSLDFQGLSSRLLATLWIYFLGFQFFFSLTFVTLVTLGLLYYRSLTFVI